MRIFPNSNFLLRIFKIKNIIVAIDFFRILTI